MTEGMNDVPAHRVAAGMLALFGSFLSDLGRVAPRDVLLARLEDLPVPREKHVDARAMLTRTARGVEDCSAIAEAAIARPDGQTAVL